MELHGLSHLFIDDQRIEIRRRNRSRRKTRIVMSYHPEGVLLVDAPPGTNNQELQTMVYKNEAWLRSQVRKHQAEDTVVYPTTYTTGSTLYFQGERIELVLEESERPKVALNGHSLRVWVAPRHSIQGVVHEWLRFQANSVFKKHVDEVCRRSSLVDEIPPWSHDYMKSRWGSCSEQARLRLNTHLIKMPPDVLDLVIVHELCHFKEMNHGPKFYELMSAELPDWRERETTLKRYGQLLQEELLYRVVRRRSTR